MKKWLLLLVLPLILFQECKSKDQTAPKSPSIPPLTFSECATGKGFYLPGETVQFSCTIHNRSSQKVEIRKVSLHLADISKPQSFAKDVSLKELVSLNPNERQQLKAESVWTIPADIKNEAYGVFIRYEYGDGQSRTDYLTFFRAGDAHTLTTYKIDTESYKGLTVFKLDGGMSAEYSVEKSLESLHPSVSHSWEVNEPGSGPNPVFATPQFLVSSVEKTVNTYNEVLGENTPLETVIISTGMPSIPNLSYGLKAPVLPLHFLVSSNTEKEVQSILDYSISKGLKCYATLGYDLSVPTAVSWIKLLDLPPAYLTFIKQHKVKNVIIAGSTGVSGGETKAKQVQNRSNGKYQSGSIYILFPANTSNDIIVLNEKIKDFNELTLGEFTYISDWESGTISNQINSIGSTLKKETSTKYYSLTAEDLIDLYDLGTDLTMAGLKKNGIPLKGIALNPYLISHPAYEESQGFASLCYWQINPPQSTVDRLNKNVQKAAKVFFSDVDFKNLTIWVNSSNNFGGSSAATQLIATLKQNGYSNLKLNNFTQDEVWNPADGMDAPCEKVAADILSDKEYFNRYKQQKPLTIDEFIKIASGIPGIMMKKE